jgi:Acyl-CoA synthetase (NDP forming)
MGGSRMQLAANVLNEAKIPTFEYPDDAARSFAYMWRYSSYLQALYETPVFTGDLSEDGPRRVAEIIAGAVAKDRTVLPSMNPSSACAYELPVTLSRLASTADEAVAAAKQIGYPVVLKLNSETVTHKSDRGGVH